MKKLFLIFVLLIFFLFTVKAQFDTDISLIRQPLSGESFVKTIKITSEKSGEIEIIIKSNSDFISIDKHAITFDSESKEESLFVTLDSKDLDKGIYVGSLIIKSNSQTIEIPIIIHVVSEIQTFGATIQIQPKYVEVVQGDPFIADIVIVNLGSDKSIVNLETGILNLEGGSIYSNTETVTFTSRSTRTVSFDVSESHSPGKYVFYALVENEEESSFAVSSQIFDIRPYVALSPLDNLRDKIFSKFLFLIIGGIIVLLAAFVFFNRFWNKKLVYMKEANDIVRMMKDNQITYLKEKAISEMNIMKEEKESKIENLQSQKKDKEKEIKILRTFEIEVVKEKLMKLERQRKLLDEAFSKEYVTEKSYIHTIKKIDELIAEVKKRL